MLAAYRLLDPGMGLAAGLSLPRPTSLVLGLWRRLLSTSRFLNTLRWLPSAGVLLAFPPAPGDGPLLALFNNGGRF